MTALRPEHTNKKWFYTDVAGHQAVLLVTDIDAFSDALIVCKEEATSDQLRDQIEDIMGLVEFSPVTIKKNGTVKWQSGSFV
jgi:hypothetical protein